VTLDFLASELSAAGTGIPADVLAAIWALIDNTWDVLSAASLVPGTSAVWPAWPQ